MKKYLFILVISFLYSTVTDIDGNIYKTVVIGDQLWMAENLKATHYRNGDEISSFINNDDLAAYYIGDNTEIFGYLYNWYAVADERGLCPEGFHVPLDSEIMDLETFLGMDQSELNDLGWRGEANNIGGKLKDTSLVYWAPPNANATNESGFSGVGNGYTHDDGTFNYENRQYGSILTSSGSDDDNAWFRSLRYSDGSILRNVDTKLTAHAVRCLTYDIIQGCTHPNASNFDEQANVDDGSCEFETVQIGHQVWMTENLKATHYRNGDAILTGLDNSIWSSTVEGAYAVYDNDPANAEIYGNLYNWYAVDDERGLCPDGWHVPSDEEFKVLEIQLGMSREEADNNNLRGSNEGSKLAGSIDSWVNGDLNQNSDFGLSNFNFLPGGYRDDINGNYFEITTNGHQWSTSSFDDFNAWRRDLAHDYTGVFRNHLVKQYGFSVRCVSDEIMNTTIYVPEDFPTIQQAIDYSIDGDTVLVAAGTYYENINFNGKNIAVIGEDRETTIIDGGGNGSVVFISELNIGLLKNFSIINGLADNGGGIRILNSNITIERCIISNCLTNTYPETPTAYGASGGGVSIDSLSNVNLNNSIFKLNHSDDYGGGIAVRNSHINYYNCKIDGNTANHAGGGILFANSTSAGLNSIIINNHASNYGNGIYSHNSIDSLFNCNIINNNQSLNSGGIALRENIATIINSSIIRNNGSENINYMEMEWSDSAAISYSNIQGEFEGQGNIDADPQFNHDYTLQSTSPCIDVGDPESELDPDGTRADMGAYPFFQIPGCIDELACNYNPDANISDNTCDYSCVNSGSYSLLFDAAGSSVTELYNLNIPETDLITFSIDFKLDDYIHQSNHNHIFDLEGGPVRYTLVVGSDYMEMRFEGYSLSFPFEADVLDSQWHNINVQATSNSVNIYLDGISVVSESWDSPSVQHVYPGGEAFLGANDRSSQYGYFMKGQLDNFIISGSLLSFEDIKNLNFDNNLMAYYMFDNAPPNGFNPGVAYDFSSRNQYGTIHDYIYVENIEGCIDELACNYNSDANISDNTCAYNDLCGECGGNNTSCEIIYDIDGNAYGTVAVGNQTWMRENLKTTHYNNGDAIHTGHTNDEWSELQTGAYAVYDDSLTNSELYGNLYNWYAVDDERGVCPQGYHVASDTDWKKLEVSLGMSIEESNGDDWRGSNQGSKLAGNINLWNEGGLKNDIDFEASGFDALPGGGKSYDIAPSDNINRSALFWTASLSESSFPYHRELSYNKTSINRYEKNANYGFSVRCIEDILGCTDSLACNYDEDANTDDGSCEYNADTWYVSTDGDNANCGSEQYPLASIQYAIDSASDGEEVYVLEGTYYENINFNGKNIALIGEDRETTIIDGGQEESVLKVVHGEQNTFISELTLQNGYAHSIISGSEFDHGGGISVLFGSFINIQNCIIKNCVAAYGGGISVVDSSSRIRVNNTLIYNNESASLGGGIAVLNGSDAEVINCNIYGNNSPEDVRIGGIAIGSTGTTLDLKNSIIFNNYPNDIKSWNAYGCYESLSIAYSLTSEIDAGCENYINNNINESPLFIDSDNEDFTLQSTSPCIDAGDPNSASDPDGTRADIGAYPFQQIQNTIELSEGNNLISFYAIPKDNSLNNVLSSLGGSADGIIGEGVAASNLNGNWIGSLSSIQPGKGYWLNMEQEGTLILTGIPIQPDQLYELNIGNNLISYPFNTPSAITNVIPDLYEGYFSSFIGEGVAASQIQPGFWVGSLSQLQKNKAYWVRVSQSMDLNFEEPE